MITETMNEWMRSVNRKIARLEGRRPVSLKKFSASSVATTNPQTFAHGLGSADLVVTVKQGSTVIYPSVTVSATSLVVTFPATPTIGLYRITAIG